MTKLSSSVGKWWQKFTRAYQSFNFLAEALELDKCEKSYMYIDVLSVEERVLPVPNGTRACLASAAMAQ